MNSGPGSIADKIRDYYGLFRAQCPIFVGTELDLCNKKLIMTGTSDLEAEKEC
jgi:hypothetical protein